MSHRRAALGLSFCSIVILGTAIDLAHAAVTAPNRNTKRDIDAIQACLGKLPGIGQCVVVCDLQRVEATASNKIGDAFTCAQSADYDSINRALSEKWPNSCASGQEVLISPVRWQGRRSAVIYVGIPAGPAGPDTCMMTRNIFGRWKVRLGIRE